MMFLRRPTLLLRFAVCLLAVLQGVAVSWHVCELGGPHGSHGAAAHCHPVVQGAEAQQCHTADDPTRAWRMALDSAPDSTGAAHCLAALLSTTPAQTTQPFELSCVVVTREIGRSTAESPLCSAPLFRSDARGPPSFS